MSIVTLHESDQGQIRKTSRELPSRTTDVKPPAQRRMRWSHADYHKLIDAGVLEGKRVELWDGEIVQKAPHSFDHFQAVERTRRALIATSPESHSILQQLPCILQPDTEREPDVVVVEGDFCDIGEFPTSPTLAIEVSLSTLREDRHEKASLYARNSIQTYWIVNCVDRTLEVRSCPVEDAKAPFGWHYSNEQVFAEDSDVALPYAADRKVRVDDLLPINPGGSDECRDDVKLRSAEKTAVDASAKTKASDK